MNLLVIDVGTSSMRGILYNPQAEVLCSHQVKYEVNYIDEKKAEQDPADWSNALYEIGSYTAAYCRSHNHAVCGVSLTSQRSSVIPVLEDGTPLRAAIMWMDKRNQDLIRDLSPYGAAVTEKAGARLNTVYSGSKMAWIREEEPQIYEKAYKLITIADYLAFLMTGNFRTDQTYGSRSLLMNLRTGQWDQELLSIFGIDQDKLCDLIEPGGIHGTLSAEFSDKTGLPEGIPLVSAGGDQQCAALGHGVTGKGKMEITTGTGAFILAYSEAVPEAMKGDVICGAHAQSGSYILESSILSCASAYDWFFKNFYSDEGYDEINSDAEASGPGANGCVVLPYFQGRGTPDWNSQMTAMFANITLNTSKKDMARAVLEGILYEIKNNIEVLEQYTGATEQIYVSGGLTKMPVFNQMQADIYGREVICPSDSEKTSAGAWVSAAVRLGLYEDLDTAVRIASAGETCKVYQPDQDAHKIYEKQRALMKELYQKHTG